MRRHLLGVSVVALDVLWLGAWLRWLAASGAPGTRPPGVIAMTVIGLTAFAVGTAISRARGEMWPLRAASILVGLAVTVAMARFVLYPFQAPTDMSWLGRFASEAAVGATLTSARLLVVAAAFLWWRGTRVGASVITPVLVRRRVNIAVGALVVLAVVVRLTHPVHLATWVVATAVCALTALALGRLEDASTGYGGTTADFGPTWLGLTASAVAFVVAAAAVISSLLSIEAARAMARALWPLPEVLFKLFILGVGAVVGWAYAAAEKLTSWLASVFGPVDEAQPMAPQVPYPQQAEGWAGLVHLLPAGAIVAIQMAVFALIVAFIAYLLSRALRRAYDRGGDRAVGEHDSELTPGRVLSDALGLARGAIAAGVAALGRVGPGSRGVRSLYARLLDAMAELGLERPPSDTPYEYQPVPTSALPAVGDDIAELTEAYVHARYGAQEPTQPRLRGLRMAWARIKKAAGARQA